MLCPGITCPAISNTPEELGVVCVWEVAGIRHHRNVPDVFWMHFDPQEKVEEHECPLWWCQQPGGWAQPSAKLQVAATRCPLLQLLLQAAWARSSQGAVPVQPTDPRGNFLAEETTHSFTRLGVMSMLEVWWCIRFGSAYLNSSYPLSRVLAQHQSDHRNKPSWDNCEEVKEPVTSSSYLAFAYYKTIQE